jgi:hypothetical protein
LTIPPWENPIAAHRVAEGTYPPVSDLAEALLYRVAQQ